MAKPSSFDISHLRFFLVDNDTNLRNMVASALRSFYVEDVEEAETAEEFISKVDKFRPDIILCEWELPDINGLDLTRKIRRGEVGDYPLVAIIFLTAHTQQWQVAAARDAGITEFLAKPVSPKALYERICAVIEKPRAFIEADEYVGPDRRRRSDEQNTDAGRRSADAPAAGGTDAVDEAAANISDDDVDRMLGL